MMHEATVAYAQIVATTGNVPAALAAYDRIMAGSQR